MTICGLPFHVMIGLLGAILAFFNFIKSRELGWLAASLFALSLATRP